MKVGALVFLGLIFGYISPSIQASTTTDVLAIARSLIAAQRLPEARPPLEQLLTAEPSNTEARHLLARCYLGLQRYDDAIATLAPLLPPPPPLPTPSPLPSLLITAKPACTVPPNSAPAFAPSPLPAADATPSKRPPPSTPATSFITKAWWSFIDTPP
ncbi:tetratricopeptide repeat protein [Geminisphaera colitermitum]|uniref:tetratricopeptide repeat protein n=1 Tax=Geminisphaera colitermitum TaxID=1148786 RepID=UPI001E5D9FA6|nr:tetratricopeptide repeat protein [Geminisphaera colitermitum]